MIITYSSLKGGVSKTTSSILTALILSKQYKTLMIDLDPQNSLTSFFISDYEQIQRDNIFNALKGDIPFEKSIHQVSDNLDIIPSVLELEQINIWNRVGKELLLKKAIEKLDYKYIVIDTPPSLMTTAVLGLITANVIVIPAKLEALDTRAIDFVLNKIDEIKDFNTTLKNIYILPVQYSHQNKTVHELLLEELLKNYKKYLLSYKIPYASKFSQLHYIGYNDKINIDKFNEYSEVVNYIIKRK